VIVLEPSGGASGQASDIAIHAKEILRIRDLLTQLYQKHCTLRDEKAELAAERFSKKLLVF
jgi:ATP-dependent Clp protease protease subunit